MIRGAITAISALAFTAMPMGAYAAPAAARAPAVMDDSQELVGTTAWILAGLGAILIIWGIIELTDDDEPSSP